MKSIYNLGPELRQRNRKPNHITATNVDQGWPIWTSRQCWSMYISDLHFYIKPYFHYLKIDNHDISALRNKHKEENTYQSGGLKEEKKLTMKILVLIERVFFFLEAATNQTSQFLHLQVFCICNPINMRWDEKAEPRWKLVPMQRMIYSTSNQNISIFSKNTKLLQIGVGVVGKGWEEVAWQQMLKLLILDSTQETPSMHNFL